MKRDSDTRQGGSRPPRERSAGLSNTYDDARAVSWKVIAELGVGRRGSRALRDHQELFVVEFSSEIPDQLGDGLEHAHLHSAAAELGEDQDVTRVDLVEQAYRARSACRLLARTKRASLLPVVERSVVDAAELGELGERVGPSVGLLFGGTVHVGTFLSVADADSAAATKNIPLRRQESESARERC
jgi:hypothetical protein